MKQGRQAIVHLVVCSLLIVLGPLTNWVSAQSNRIESSLDLVPADAAFYFSTMNHDLLWKAVIESNALARLRESPAGSKMRRAYRKGVSRGWEQFGDNPLRHYLEGYANSIDSVPGKMVMPYLERLFAKEFFVFADHRLIDFFTAIQSLSEEMQPMLQAQALDENSEISPEQMVELIQKHMGEIQLPTIVIGTVVKEPEVFVGMLELMQTGLNQLKKEGIPETEFLLKHLSLKRSENQHYLAFEATGRDIPWQEIAESDPDFRDVAPILQEMFEEKTLAIAIGIREDAFLISIGPSLEVVKQFGNGSRLIDTNWLKPVSQARERGEKVVAVSYVSEEYLNASKSGWGQLAVSAAGLVGQAIGRIENDSFSVEDRNRMAQKLQSDAAEFSREMAQFDTRMGTRLSYCVQSPEGIEGFAYDYGSNPNLDGSAPLSLLRHVGSSPMFFVINRGVTNEKLTQVLEKYGSRLNEFIQEIVPITQDSDLGAQQTSDVANRVLPLLSDLGESTIKLALDTSGKEAGLVMDLSVAKNSWSVAMPQSSQPLPMLGLAIVSQFRDAKTLQAVGNDYLTVAQKLLDIIREQNTEIPEEVQIRFPERKLLNGAECFYYKLPDELGMDPSISLHAALDQQTLVLGYSEDLTQALLQEKSNSIFGPAGQQRAAASATFFDNRQLFDGLHAWIKYGFEQAQLENMSIELTEGSVADLQMNEEEIRETVSRLMDFMKCFHGYSAQGYLDSGVQVQHFLFKFQDLDK